MKWHVVLFDIVTQEGDNLSLVTVRGNIRAGGGGIIHTRCVDNRWDLLRLYKSGSLPVILDSKAVLNWKYHNSKWKKSEWTKYSIIIYHYKIKLNQAKDTFHAKKIDFKSDLKMKSCCMFPEEQISHKEWKV